MAVQADPIKMREEYLKPFKISCEILVQLYIMWNFGISECGEHSIKEKPSIFFTLSDIEEGS